MSSILIVSILLFIFWLLCRVTHVTLGGLVQAVPDIAGILVVIWFLRSIVKVF